MIDVRYILTDRIEEETTQIKLELTFNITLGEQTAAPSYCLLFFKFLPVL